MSARGRPGVAPRRNGVLCINMFADIILAAITSAVKGVFTAVLYRYAGTGVFPVGFFAREIDSTLGERKRDPWDINV